MIKHIKEDNLYSFKMANGEELVGKVTKVDVDANTFSLERGFAIGMTQEGPQLVPALFTGNPQEEVWINMDTVAVVAVAASDMEDVYRQVVTGIKTPPKQIITG